MISGVTPTMCAYRMPRRSTAATIAMRALSSPWRGCTQRIPASARSSAARTAGGGPSSGRDATSSTSTPSTLAPALSSAASRLAATPRLAWSAINATRSRGRMPRQTSTALRAPGSSSTELRPKKAEAINEI